MTSIFPVCNSDLSRAWLSAFALTMAPGRCPPMTVSVSDFGGDLPSENPIIRQAVDVALERNNKVSVEDTAFTIFPYSTWLRLSHKGRDEFFDRYRRMYPRLIARDKQKYGTYFKRLIDYDGIYHGKPRVVNQLDHIISIWNRDQGRNRRSRTSALQAALLDPAKDHTGQPVRGFPCLQQIGFGYNDSGQLAISAFYPTQYIFDRAYRNYLGLCHLGLFMAHEMGLTFGRLDVFVATPVLSDNTPKRNLTDLHGMALTLIPNNLQELRQAS